MAKIPVFCSCFFKDFEDVNKDCPVLIKSAFDIAGKLADQGTVGEYLLHLSYLTALLSSIFISVN